MTLKIIQPEIGIKGEYRLRVEKGIDLAHRLYGYSGKCKNLHGHRFYFEIEIYLDNFNREVGISIDFTEIKKILKQLDHAVILFKEDPLYKYLKENYKKLDIDRSKIIGLDGNPTAENIAEFVVNNIESKKVSPHIANIFVTVYETPSNSFSMWYSKE